MGKDTVSLREYIDRIFRERDRALKTALSSLNRRLKSMNEFRQTLSDQAGTFVTKTEFNALKERMDKQEGRSSGFSAGWGYLIAAITVLIGVAGIVIVLITRH